MRNALHGTLMSVLVVAAGCGAFRTRGDRPVTDDPLPTPPAENRPAGKFANPPADPAGSNPGGGLDSRGIERNDRPGLLDAPPRSDADAEGGPVSISPEVQGLRAGNDVPDLPADGAAAGTESAGSAGSAQSIARGESMPVGGVIARVNGEAIYTDDVLRAVRPVLRARARTLSRDAYADAAAEEIGGQLRRLVMDKLALEDARARLTAREQMFVDAKTYEYRQEQIVRAGGSEAVADRLAREAGYDGFDNMVVQKHDELMIDVFRERKLRPRVRVTAEEMRRRYQRERDTLFTTQEAAEFLLIRTEDAKSGGQDGALAKAQTARGRVEAGEAFGDVAADEAASDSPGLRAGRGDLGMGPLARGTYRDPAVEEAVYAARPGEIVGPIRVAGGYVVAQVVSKTEGDTRSFGDTDVQDELRRMISREKYLTLQEEEGRRRQDRAVVAEVEGGLDSALEIALRDYDHWNAGNAGD